MRFTQLRALALMMVMLAAPAWSRGAPVVFNIHQLVDKPDDWFLTPEGRSVADNIVSWQNANGGWYKNMDVHLPRPAVLPKDSEPGDQGIAWLAVSTIDNDATHSELRILARAYRVLKKPADRQSFDRGLQYLLRAQYANGGWPQRFPLGDDYGRYITFNDHAMTQVVALMKDIADNKPDFFFLTSDQRDKCRESYLRGVDCIIKCQIKIDGQLTVWCQQHDTVTLAPRGARKYELPSLVGFESARIVRFLMTIDNPDDRLRLCIESAVAWFEKAQITGKRVVDVTGPQYEHGRDKILVDDPSAPPLWARFYDLQTGKPFFCDKRGIPCPSMDHISYERRNGYNWYGEWGTPVADTYKKWKSRLEQAPTTQP